MYLPFRNRDPRVFLGEVAVLLLSCTSSAGSRSRTLDFHASTSYTSGSVSRSSPRVIPVTYAFWHFLVFASFTAGIPMIDSDVTLHSRKTTSGGNLRYHVEGCGVESVECKVRVGWRLRLSYLSYLCEPHIAISGLSYRYRGDDDSDSDSSSGIDRIIPMLIVVGSPVSMTCHFR